MRMSELYADLEMTMSDSTQPPPFNVGRIRTGPVTPLTEHRVIIEQVTLRDQFAMAALTGLLANPVGIGWSQCAEDCYQMADKMLKAREAK